MLLMCYINTDIWMTQRLSQLKDSEEGADEKKTALKKLFEHPAVC